MTKSKVKPEETATGLSILRENGMDDEKTEVTIKLGEDEGTSPVYGFDLGFKDPTVVVSGLAAHAPLHNEEEEAFRGSWGQEEEPKTLQELADPKYCGKVGLRVLGEWAEVCALRKGHECGCLYVRVSLKDGERP